MARRHDRQEGCLDRPREPLPTRVEDGFPLPDDYHDALDAALAAMAIALSPVARQAIDGHVRLLLAWNAAINLTAIREPAAIAVRHVADSLAALPILRARSIDALIDLGSGGGFPGIPLAAALPAERALLVDSVAKKATFLAAVVEAVGLADRVVSEPARAERLARGRDREAWPAVTARAVASLADLVEVGLPLLEPRGILVAWKRSDHADDAALGDELAAAGRALASIDPRGDISVLPALPHRVDDPAAVGAVADIADHCLVVVERGAGRIPAEWPRDPAVRRRRPW